MPVSTRSTHTDGSAHSDAIIDVNIEKASKLISDGQVQVIDVRTPQEYAISHIQGAINHNILDQSFKNSINTLDPKQKYLVHCASGKAGGRSRRASQALNAAGIKMIYHLNGGISAWIKGGHAIVTSDDTQSHDGSVVK